MLSKAVAAPWGFGRRAGWEGGSGQSLASPL